MEKVVLSRDDSHKNWIVHVDVETGSVYTAYPAEDYAPHADASVQRAFYSGGYLNNSSWIVTENIYTRSSNKLEHDFFYIMNEGRCEEQSHVACRNCGSSDTSNNAHCSVKQVVSEYCDQAYMNYPGLDQYIRASRRTNRDFENLAFRHHVEPHVYHWSRWYMQWQKSALEELDLLESSASEFTRALIVVNPCRKGSYHSRNEFVRTEDGKGDGLSKVFLRTADGNHPSYSEYNPSPSLTYYFANPPVIAHELNHYIMHRYLDVNSALDCGAAEPNENRLFHEGVLGSVLPQRHWHSNYSVGYAPVQSAQLWFSHSPVGWVHTASGNLSTRSSYGCSGSVYNGGRVLGQGLWKTVFGNHWDANNNFQPIASVPDKDDFISLVYTAAMAADSTSLENFALMYTFFAVVEGLIGFSEAYGWCQMFELHMPDARGKAFNDYCCIWGSHCME